MTVTLAADTEADLHTLAQRRGQAPEAFLDALVRRAAAEERELQAAAQGVQAGMEDFAAGRWVGLEDLEAESRTWAGAQQIQDL